MNEPRVILTHPQFGLVVERIVRQLLEQFGDFENTMIVGIQPRGTYFAKRLHKRLLDFAPSLELGILDITFFRDDFRQGEKSLLPNPMVMPSSPEGKRIILVDDVLYTGRTISAAISALQNLGRPKDVELAVMVERRFHRELPIAPDYVGVQIDALNEAYVRVQWNNPDQKDEVKLYPNKDASKT